MRAVFDSTHSARWLLAGYIGAAGFFVQEMVLRRPGTAASLNASDDDRGTTRALLASSGAAYGLPLLLSRLPLARMPSTAAAAGLVLQACGFALRVWSMNTLGSFYSRTLRTIEDQTVVDTGPYRLIRHPGYAGALLVWTGLALTSRSAPAAVLVTALMGRVYRRRIVAEELLLQRNLPDYGAYLERTKMLIPHVW
ncbi:protein-S-isoprenylcysteine O-methyltransferase Ste14 [Mycobacterium sp. MAA66]|uniref:methyltransferase family protein n=1 Tax=Mycobacterium sp. MAA66 TaxID=3156297 RepID=UPI00351833DE